MAKMLMGQIDHARNRLTAISKEKIGPSPTRPKQLDVDDLKKALRAGDITVSPAKMKAAFNSWVVGEEITTVNCSTNYHYGGRSNTYTYTIVQEKPGSLEEYIAALFYDKPNAAEIKRYTKDTETFEARTAIVTVEATKVEDAIVLGDQQAALIALQAFAAFEV